MPARRARWRRLMPRPIIPRDSMTLTQDQIEDVFWGATVSALGLDPVKKDTQKRVRISWPKPDSGNSNWEREENVVFLRISPAYDDYAVQKDITQVYDSGNDTLYEQVDYHRCYQIQWVCYGPDSAEDADMIRIGILREPVKAYLRGYGIAMKPDIREPVRMPEPDQSGDWWERTDLTAQCYILFSRKYVEGMMEHVTITSGFNPGSQQENDPGEEPGTDPGTDPSQGDDPGTDPGTDPGEGGDPDPGEGDDPGSGDSPGTDPGNEQGNEPGEDQQTDPASGIILIIQ